MSGVERPIIPDILIVAILAFAFALLFFIPSREVTQPPGKWQTLWEVLAPGTSPAWHVLGGFVLIAWSYFVVQDILLLKLRTPYILFAISVPNLNKAYGVPSTDVFGLMQPSWVWVYLAPAVLFAVNLVLVFRDKLFRKKV